MSNFLYITNISGKSMDYKFCGTSIEATKSLGYAFYSVANRSISTAENIEEDEKKYGVKLLHFDLVRSPFSLKNYKAYKQLCKIIRENNIDYIHCNTPVGGILGRLAGKKCKVKKVIYQAHGFHFYKGAPKKNWLVYYRVEKWLARHTDALITINHEDYELAKAKLKLRNGGKVHYVPGVGIDLKQYSAIDKESVRSDKRNELGLLDDDVMLISAGELNENKNNRVIIEAMSALKNPKVHYFLCGVGDKKEELENLVKDNQLEAQVHFLGYRTDILELLCASDVFVMPSYREGLSRSIMEAMAIGLPCVVSKIRGNVDMISDEENGMLCNATDVEAFRKAIDKLASDPCLRQRISENNIEKIKLFEFSIVSEKLKEIYEGTFN